MKRIFSAVIIFFLLLNVACKKTRKVQEDVIGSPTLPPPATGFKIDTVASELQIPWGIGFLPNGDLLFSERYGKIRLLKKGEKSPTIVMARSVWASGEGGLLGLAVDPEFSTNH